MIPKRPFPGDFSPEREVAEFRRLQPRLTELWNELSAHEEEPYTSVVIPSLTLDQRELEKLEGSSYYEERLLFLLIRLRNPHARMVYVTSRPVHPLILEYYLELLAGIPAIQHAGRRIGEALAKHGVVTRLAVDFLVRRSGESGAWEVFALEINLRVGGTTHPFLALQFLTGGDLDPDSGLFHSPAGLAKFYRSTDNLKKERYRGLTPEDLLDITTINRLHYSQGTETGVLFHMIGAMSQYGKIGLTVIGNSREQVDELYDHTLQVLDRETEYTSRVASPEPHEPPREEFRHTIDMVRIPRDPA